MTKLLHDPRTDRLFPGHLGMRYPRVAVTDEEYARFLSMPGIPYLHKLRAA